MLGGALTTTSDVENYLGFEKINGYSLTVKMIKHTETAGVKIIESKVSRLEYGVQRAFRVVVWERYFNYDAVILATGSTAKSLGIPGEQELFSKGVSTCAVCDGNFFKQKITVVIGGGDTALEEAMYLAGICKKV